MQIAVDLSPLWRYPVFSTAVRLIELLKHAGYEAYIVGGMPRDFLLGRHSADIDIATSARPEIVEQLLPDPRRIGASFGVVLCVCDGVPFEVASFRTEGEYRDGRHPANLNYTDSAVLDAARRDFTCNAFYLDPHASVIHDFFNGYADLQQGVLRTVGHADARFKEDYLRMLRAVRFAVRFGFRMTPEISEAARHLAPNIATLSGERIRSELSGMLLSGRPGDAVRLLDELGLLAYCLPEVYAMKGVEQHPVYHPEGDVFKHTLLCLDKLIEPDAITVWAALLHDIGKPGTLSYDEQGIPHFFSHEQLSASMCQTVLARLKFDKKTAHAVTETVAMHMRFVPIRQMKPSTLRKLLGDPLLKQEAALLLADTLASHGDLSVWLYLLDQLALFEQELPLPPPLVNGRDALMAGFVPGAALGLALTRIRERQLDGILNSRVEALTALAKILTESGQ